MQVGTLNKCALHSYPKGNTTVYVMFSFGYECVCFVQRALLVSISIEQHQWSSISLEKHQWSSISIEKHQWPSIFLISNDLAISRYFLYIKKLVKMMRHRSTLKTNQNNFGKSSYLVNITTNDLFQKLTSLTSVWRSIQLFLKAQIP